MTFFETPGLANIMSNSGITSNALVDLMISISG